MVEVIGMGPGAIRLVTPEAREMLLQSDKLLAFGRIGQTASEILKEARKEIPIITINRVSEVIAQLTPSFKTSLLASGDPLFYGIVDLLKREGVEVNRIVPGLSSFQYMAARLQKSWNNARFVSFHGRTFIINDFFANSLFVILTDSDNLPGVISRRLAEGGFCGNFYVGTELSYPEERIVSGKIGDPFQDAGPLSVVIVETEGVCGSEAV